MSSFPVDDFPVDDGSSVYCGQWVILENHYPRQARWGRGGGREREGKGKGKGEVSRIPEHLL